MKDAKHIFICAKNNSESMIAERILVKVLPELLKHNIHLTSEMIESSEHILLPDDLYLHIRRIAEALTGLTCCDQ